MTALAVVPRGASRGPNSYLEMAGRTRAIVRLDGWNRMVTKGYRKGVYERVTLGNQGGEAALYRKDGGPSPNKWVSGGGGVAVYSSWCERAGNLWTEGNRDHDLDTNHTDVGGR
jgi:hypothetical protein